MRAIIEQLTPTPTTSFITRHIHAPGFPFLWHLHPEFELTLILKGQGRRFVGDHIAPFEKNDLVLLGKNLPHTWSSEPAKSEALMKHEAIVVQFLENAFGQNFFNLPELRPIRRLLDDACRGLVITGKTRTAVLPSIRALATLKPAQKFLPLLEILSHLAHAPAKDKSPLAAPGFSPEVDRPGQQRIADVCRWINEHYEQPLTLTKAAQKAHLSISAFSRFFKNATAKTFIEYLNEVRLGHAARLLLDTDLPISQIAYTTGYSNLSHFNRQFLRQKSTPPRTFRQSHTLK
jgi:AraC-like DNA-binding protein